MLVQRPLRLRRPERMSRGSRDSRGSRGEAEESSGLSTARSAPLDGEAPLWTCDDGLTAWAWLDRLPSVLRSLTLLGTLGCVDEPDVRLLAPLLAHVGATAGRAMQQRLQVCATWRPPHGFRLLPTLRFVRFVPEQWVLERSDVLKLHDAPRRDEAACELYELLNQTVVPAEYDMGLVYAALERNVLRPLRKARVAVPSGLLSREQAWSLAHASEFVASTADEMVDPWDYVDDDGAPPASHGGAGPSGVSKEPVDMSDDD